MSLPDLPASRHHAAGVFDVDILGCSLFSYQTDLDFAGPSRVDMHGNCLCPAAPQFPVVDFATLRAGSPFYGDHPILFCLFLSLEGGDLVIDIVNLGL